MYELLRFLRCYRSYRAILSRKNAVLLQDFSSLSDKVVERETYLLAMAHGKRVLHFGFIDSIFLEQKLAEGTLLHKRLQAVADSVFGIDIDEHLLESYRALTNDRHNTVYDIAEGTGQPFLRNNYDLILFPEVLEHVPNPGSVLKNLRQLCILNKATLCITVPNGFYTEGFVAAMHGQELVHPDHLYYFTPHTLQKLLEYAGFGSIDLRFYNFGSSLAPGLTKAGIVAVCTP
jgi:hypothetical protein